MAQIWLGQCIVVRMASLISGRHRPRRVTESVADYVRARIRDGLYWPGDRLPSVRSLARQLDVSVSTVVDAYQILEQQGLLTSREKSGFFVRLAAVQTLRKPVVTQPDLEPRLFDRNDYFLQILADLRREGVVQLATASPAHHLLPKEPLGRLLRSCAREYADDILDYGDIAGHRFLREQIARRAMASGCTLSPDEIIVTTGATEALNLCLGVLCQAGDVIAVESPGYYGVLGASRSHGLNVLELPTDPQTGVHPDDLQAALDLHNVKAIVLTPNFNNPIGALMPDDAKEAIVAMAASREIPLIEDDVYGDLGFNDERPVNMKSFDTEGNVLLCSSVSKTIAPGYRIGWVAGGRHRSKLEMLKFSSTCYTSTLPQLAVAEFFQRQRYTHYVRRAVSYYRQSVRSMTAAVLESFPDGTRCNTPQGGFVLWVELPKSCDAVDLYGIASAQGINFMPGPAFTTQDGYRNCLRLNASRWSQDVDDAVRRLGSLAKAQVLGGQA